MSSPRSRSASRDHASPHSITPALLRRHAIPALDDESDKDTRGRVLVVGGSREMPGAVILAGIAALRSGAGKLQLAVGASTAPMVALAVPEALVKHLPETRAGGISVRAASALREHAASATGILVGPGMREERATDSLVTRLVGVLITPPLNETILVVDAAAFGALARDDRLLHPLGGRVVITPHAGEMATLLDVSRTVIERDPLSHALHVARRWKVVVALKGGSTVVATPDGISYRYTRGRVGLATSGSGDVLAGLTVGLAARGASALDATLWSVYLHGEAGNRLGRRVGPIGYLARELSAEFPALLESVG
ncbi:MAG: NAD(P)H-hydrate dehydratase [Gemmatimonadaceae bacterium]